MFFQISPGIKKKTKPVSQVKPEDEEAKIEILFLAPFTPNPKIVFEDVVIGSVQSRKLLVKNTTARDISLFIKKPIPEELNLTLSWTKATIEKGNEVLLEMVWGPTTEEACRHSIIISDGQKLNRDVSIIFKSVNPKRIKSGGAKTKPKPKQNAATLPLTRKSISPMQKLKQQRKFSTKPQPLRRNPPMKFNSPPLRIQRQQSVENQKTRNVNYNILDTKQTYGYQNSVWANENIFDISSYTLKENKENLSPMEPTFRGNFSGSFASPTNATFNMDGEKLNERRETYVLNPLTLKEDTYIWQTNNTFEIDSKFDEMTKSFFTKSPENSPYFRDSLESTSPKLPLREKNDFTPTLETMLSKKLRTASHVEYKSRVMNFSFSPALTSDSVFAPTICSTSSKPASTDNSLQNTARPAMELFDQTATQLNESNETYTKANISSETYVKGNTSQETYIKGNISGETYTKENSINDISNIDVSPLSSRMLSVPSPVFLKPKAFIFSPVREYAGAPADTRLAQNLSAIVEESGIFNDSSFRVGSKRKSNTFNVLPTKRERKSIESKKDWSKSGGIAVRVASRTSGLNLKQYAASQDHSQPLSSITETLSKTVIVKNPFLYANIMDPFMTSQVYCNEDWIEQQENNFKKWLNALLTPPEELNTKNEVDVAKVWQECTKKDVSEAPTKEKVSMKYHTNNKLEYLRKQAQQLFRSKEMSVVLQKVCEVVEAGKLSVREDKDLHLNLKLKSDIIRLILGYNPLWLRIGLETIYNEIIPLRSNSDAHGLASFIFERFLKDPHLVRKHKTVYAPKYSSDLKKFILKKFLILVYFLDRAKNEKLIQHDPCLFCKNAIEKESKLVLTHFARETLSAVGDITKYLKCLGYVVTFSQSFIHEFDFAVKNLGVDLRDGVRLTRVMEIIQMRNDLTSKLRVPAISRLQKVHNMQLVFKSLEESGYKIQYDIIAKDIVDGHKEKTLSFLWQIVYKFEAPLMVQHATTIQSWFRSLPVVLKRRKLQRLRQQREEAAQKIKFWYRRQKKALIYFSLSEFVTRYIEERRRLRAVIKLQSIFRMLVCRKRFLSQYKAITKLQAYAKGWLIRNKYMERICAAKIIQNNYRRYICQKRFLQLKHATVIIQRKYRALKQMQLTNMTYISLKRMTVTIQRKYRAKMLMRTCYQQYVTLRTATIKIQSFYRMSVARKQYLQLKSAALLVQNRFRAHKKMFSIRNDYLALRKSAISVQRRFRANLQMRKYRNSFIQLRNVIIQIQSFYRMYYLRKRFISIRKAIFVVQSHYRAQINMRIERQRYLKLKESCIYIQRLFRANKEMKKALIHFTELKRAAVKMQSQFRMYMQRKQYLKYKHAAEVIQRRYRAKKAMVLQKSYFVELKSSVVIIQKRFRANKLRKEAQQHYIHIRQTTITIQSTFRMYIARRDFLELRKASVIVQRRYLAQKAMQAQLKDYQNLRKAALIFQRKWRARKLCMEQKTRFDALKQAVINVQRKFRANKLMLHEKQTYLKTRTAAVQIQTWYRSVVTMRTCRQQYIQFKTSVIVIQQRYLAIKLMRSARMEYKNLQKAAKIVQQYYRALLLMRTSRKSYLELKSATVSMQRRLRANQLMQKHRESYQQLKHTTIFVQNVIRANKMCKIQRNNFVLQKNAVVKIQRWYRSIVEMKKSRDYYASLKLAVKTIKEKYKTKRLMIRDKHSYEQLRKATILIQLRYRNLLETKKTRRTYLEMRSATLTIQRRYRANVWKKLHQQNYQRLREVTIFIQRKFRAKKSMVKCRKEYVTLRYSSIIIQQRFRAQKQMKMCRNNYQKMLNACILIQRRYRAQKLMITHSHEYNILKEVVIHIQRRFRANLLAKKTRMQYVILKRSVLVIQHRFRAQIQMKHQRQRFIELRQAAIAIQKRYLAMMRMKQQRNEFMKLKQAALVLQTRYRAMVAMRTQKLMYDKLKKAVLFVQQKYRSNKLSRSCRADYLKLRRAAVVLQRRFRARCLTITCLTQYSRIKWAALVIQRRYRAEIAMRDEMLKYNSLRHATFIIQRKFRATILANKQRYWYLQFKKSVRTIQLRYRAYLLMKKQRELFIVTRKAVINLQRFARGYLVRKKYGPLLTPDAIESRRVLKEQTAAAIKIQTPLTTVEEQLPKRHGFIQASWRGCSLRKSNIPVMIALRNRRERKIIEPKPSSQSKTLLQRCEAAMLCMTAEHSSLLMVINALEDLDFITRHSPMLCVRLSMILPYQLYIIMTSVARSLPEMNALNTATLILINFYKYPETRKQSWHPEYMDGVVNILLHWCDKEAPLFSSLCTLLWLFGHEEKWKKVFLAIPNIEHRFKKIHSLVHRKQNMVMKSKKTNNNSVFGPLGNTQLPPRTANWGLDYDKPNTFTNAVFALGNVMKIFDIM